MYFKYLRLTTGRALTYTKKSLLYSTNYGTFSIQCKTPERRWNLKFQISNFHTTQKLNIVLLTLSFGSICCGHFVRRWWLKQTVEQQQKYIRRFKRRKHTIYGSLGFLSLILFIYCLRHLEEDPVKKKQHLILFNRPQEIIVSKILDAAMRNHNNVVPTYDIRYRVTARALKQLLNSNKNLIKKTDWTITIIHRIFDTKPLPNVIILPERNIVVFANIFDVIDSFDQLVFILAHEMSHELLLHTKEIWSFVLIHKVVAIVFTFLIWVFYESGTAATLTSIMYILFNAIFSWHKRQTEIEADEVGFELAAKSCIDPREVLVFWEIMKKIEELIYHDKIRILLFEDHPSTDKRIKRFIQLMPTALELRKQSKCPKLPARDPRDRLPRLMKNIKTYMPKN